MIVLEVGAAFLAIAFGGTILAAIHDVLDRWYSEEA